MARPLTGKEDSVEVYVWRFSKYGYTKYQFTATAVTAVSARYRSEKNKMPAFAFAVIRTTARYEPTNTSVATRYSAELTGNLANRTKETAPQSKE